MQYAFSTEASMFKVLGLFLAASAVIVFSGAARAEDKVLLALNTPVKTTIASISTELKDPATAQAVIGVTDFDVFSAVNDPLYRESSKALLKQQMNKDAEKKSASGDTLRDAPISKVALPGAVSPVKVRPLIKKTRAGKPLNTDPIKVKDTF
jgi:hypothetical protein